MSHLLLRSEIVDDVEELADLFRSLTLDHVRHGLASNIAEGDELSTNRLIIK